MNDDFQIDDPDEPDDLEDVQAYFQDLRESGEAGRISTPVAAGGVGLLVVLLAIWKILRILGG